MHSYCETINSFPLTKLDRSTSGIITLYCHATCAQTTFQFRSWQKFLRHDNINSCNRNYWIHERWNSIYLFYRAMYKNQQRCTTSTLLHYFVEYYRGVERATRSPLRKRLHWASKLVETTTSVTIETFDFLPLVL